MERDGPTQRSADLGLPVMGQLTCENGHTFTIEPFPRINVPGWEGAKPFTSTYLCPTCSVRVHKSG